MCERETTKAAAPTELILTTVRENESPGAISLCCVYIRRLDSEKSVETQLKE